MINTDFPAIGTRVFVNDGTPAPPARFKRKLEAWQNRNYEAVIVAIEDPSALPPARTAKVQHGDLFSQVFKAFSSGVRLENIKPLEAEPSYEVQLNDGFCNEVIGLRKKEAA